MAWAIFQQKNLTVSVIINQNLLNSKFNGLHKKLCSIDAATPNTPGGRLWEYFAKIKIDFLYKKILDTNNQNKKNKTFHTLKDLEDSLKYLRTSFADRFITRNKLLYYTLTHEFAHCIYPFFRNALNLTHRLSAEPYYFKEAKNNGQKIFATGFLNNLEELVPVLYETVLAYDFSEKQTALVDYDWLYKKLCENKDYNNDFMAIIPYQLFLAKAVVLVKNIIYKWLKKDLIKKIRSLRYLKKYFFSVLYLPVSGMIFLLKTVKNLVFISIFSFPLE